MTNLLCFFVLLVSFSSFDPQAQSRVTGAFMSLSHVSVFASKPGAAESVVAPPDKPVDFTDLGSEVPTDEDPVLTEQPLSRPLVPPTDAYRDRRVLYLPSAELFIGQGACLTGPARQRLKLISHFMKLVPCDVMIAESGGGDPALQRAWAVADYFITEAGIPADRLSIASRPATSPHRSGLSVVEIALLKRSLAR